MKKLLLGTMVLLAFNAAVIFTQMSCKKDAKAQTIQGPAGIQQQNSLLVYVSTPNSNVKHQLKILDYNGKVKSSISPFEPPAGFTYVDGRLSPDGTMIFFSAVSAGQNEATRLFSMKVDGTEMKEIFKSDVADNASHLSFEGAY